MKMNRNLELLTTFGCGIVTLLFAGCGTTQRTSGAKEEHFPTKYLATDGRTFEIGPRSEANNGWEFGDPRMNQCWIASNFDFNGYDTIYVAPTLSIAKIHGDEINEIQLAKENIRIELNRHLTATGIFKQVVTRESDIPPGAHVLKFENTIIEYAKGSGAGRFWAGLFGAGQPVVRVQGKITDGEKTVFVFDARRSGVSAAARMDIGVMNNVDIQLQDIRNLAIDVTDFMGAIAGKYKPKN